MTQEQFRTWFSDAKEGNSDWRGQAQEDLEFYLQQQWTSEQRALLEKEGRPPLTIPKISPIINYLSGNQRQGKTSILYRNRKGSTLEEATILTEVVRQILDLSNAPYILSEWFMLGIITGRTWLTGMVDYTYDQGQGDLKLEANEPFSVFPDPNAVQYDFSDGKYWIKTYWADVEDILDQFPNLEDTWNMTEFESDDLQVDIKTRETYQNKPILGAGLNRAGRVKIKEYWYLRSNSTIKLQKPTAVDGAPGEILTMNHNRDTIKQIQEQVPGVTVLEGSRRTKKVLWRALVAGTVILEDFQSPLGAVNRIPAVQFAPYYVKNSLVKNNIMSVITPLKDLQREVNKRRSQLMHILNSVAQSGWEIPRRVNKDAADVEDFKKNGSKNGFTYTYDIEIGKPTRIQPTAPSQGHIFLENQSESDINKASGVNPDMRGEMGEKQDPGIVLQLRQQQGSVVIEPVMDNFRASLKNAGGLLVDVITKSELYNVEEIVAIAEDGEAKRAVIEALFQNPEQKRYNVVVDTVAGSATKRLEDAAKMMEICKIYPKILELAPDIILDVLDLPKKEELMKRLGIQQPPPGGGSEGGGAPVTPPDVANLGGGM